MLFFVTFDIVFDKKLTGNLVKVFELIVFDEGEHFLVVMSRLDAGCGICLVFAFSKTNRACDDSSAKENMLSTIKCPNYCLFQILVLLFA